MRFHIGSIPEPEGGEPSGEWNSLSEPKPVMMQLIALPFGVVFGAIVGALWIYATPVTKNPVAHPVLMIGGMVALFPIHELMHAIVHPGFGFSRHTTLGLWPSRLLAYAHYDGIISRNRFIAILAMPFLVISILPLLICIVLGHASVTIAFISSLNALGACIDILGICILLFRVPSNAIVRNHGWRTYWNVPQSKQCG